jgi:hypothetical protein
LWNITTPGSIYRDISAILKINLAPVFLGRFLRLISSYNSAYQARARYEEFMLEIKLQYLTEKNRGRIEL